MVTNAQETRGRGWPGDGTGQRGATGGEAGQPARPRAGLVVLLGGPPGARDAYRIDAPARLLRMWGLLCTADEELHQVKLPQQSLPRLQRQLETVRAELARSVSPALAAELRRLSGRHPKAVWGPDELRIEYASLLGWTGGLVMGMLGPIEMAHQQHHRGDPAEHQ